MVSISNYTPITNRDEKLDTHFGKIMDDDTERERRLKNKSAKHSSVFLKKILSIRKKKTTVDDVEIQARLKWYIIYHNGMLKVIIDFVMSGAIIISNLDCLYWLAFGPPTANSIIYDSIIQFLFLLDFLANFFTSYTNKQHKTIIQVRLIAKRYITKWMVFDLLALLPLRLANLPSIEFILRTPRIIKFNRISLRYFECFCINLISNVYYNEHIAKVIVQCSIKLLKVGFLMWYIIYFLACCFLRFVRTHEPNFEANSYHSITGSNEHILLRYTYFISTTIISVGYGDYFALYSSERIAVIFIIFIGTVYYAILAGAFNSVFGSINELFPNEDKLNSLRNWIKQLEKRYGLLNYETHEKILSHFKYYWKVDKLHDISKEYWNEETYNDTLKDNGVFFKQLTEEIKKDMLNGLFKDIFDDFSQEFGESNLKYELCYYFQPRIFPVGDVIIEIGDVVHEILIIYKGKVMTEVDYDGHKIKLAFRKRKFWLGVYEVLNEKLCIRTYKTVDKRSAIPVEAYAIPRKPFLHILKNKYPSDEGRLIIDSEIMMGLMNKNIRKQLENLEPKDTNLDKMNSNEVKTRSKRKMVTINGQFAQIHSKINSYEQLIEQCKQKNGAIEQKIDQITKILETKNSAKGNKGNKIPNVHLPPIVDSKLL